MQDLSLNCNPNMYIVIIHTQKTCANLIFAVWKLIWVRNIKVEKVLVGNVMDSYVSDKSWSNIVACFFYEVPSAPCNCTELEHHISTEYGHGTN